MNFSVSNISHFGKSEECKTVAPASEKSREILILLQFLPLFQSSNASFIRHHISWRRAKQNDVAALEVHPEKPFIMQRSTRQFFFPADSPVDVKDDRTMKSS
jgi:hypothetical protein